MTNTLLVLYAHVMLLMHFLGLDLIISAHLGDKLVNRWLFLAYTSCLLIVQLRALIA